MGERNPIMLEKAQEHLMKIKMREEIETIRVTEVLGRVCAGNIYAAMDQPPFPRSPLDGYAVRNQDTTGAPRENPVRLNIIEHIRAGMYPKLRVGPGEAIRTMTGAPVPEGADSVIMQERTDEGSESVEIYQSVASYGSYCKEGEDTYRGTLLMEKGKSVHPSHIGVLSSQGIETIPVYSAPVIAIVATGDELVPVGAPLELGKIYNNNGPLLAARIRELGMKSFLLQYRGDDIEELAEEIRKQLTECDAPTTSSGVSVDVRDCMPYMTETLGADVLFHGINVRPGSPILAMIVGSRPIFCLSGNPFAAAVALEVLVRPVLEWICEKTQWKPGILLGILKGPFPKASPYRRPVRGKTEDGRVWLPKGCHSLGMLSSMAGCDCLVDIPAGSNGLKTREQVKIMLV